MTGQTTLNGPITQQRAEAATQWLVDHARDIAVARAERDRCENMLKVTRALAMKASNEKSVAAQEREAFASDQYNAAIDRLFDATICFEELMQRRFAAQAVIDVWRSLNSNLRGAT